MNDENLKKPRIDRILVISLNCKNINDFNDL